MGNPSEKEAGRVAVDAYIVEYGPEVGISDLRSYVRAKTGIEFAGPTLASFLRTAGYVREGIRKIDACPGQTVFYVRKPA